MKKKMFDIKFDPEAQPGHQTRYLSIDNLLGPRIDAADPSDLPGPKVKHNLKSQVKSMQNQNLLPSVKLRKKGLV